jgi:carbamoyltransferase
MKPHFSIFEGGHDPNFTIFDPNTKKFYIYELERILGIKNYHMKRPVTAARQKEYYGAVRFGMDHALQNHGIENDFHWLYHKSIAYNESFWDRDQIKWKHCKLNRVHHHDAHAWCGYAQSPFDKCAVISWDGKGDDTSFRTCEFSKWHQRHASNQFYQHAQVYTRAGHLCKIFKDTDTLSIAGKLMGLSAYGEMDQDYYDYFRWRMRSGYGYHKTNALDAGIDLAFNEDFAYKVESVYEHRKAFNLAYTAQKALEDDIVEWIDKHYIHTIRNYNNNLILTGGTALNVLANERIKRAFPDINVYVPPNCGDGGQSFGAMMWHLTEEEIFQEKVRCEFMGPTLWDYKQIPLYIKKRGATQITVSDIAQLLREQKIIGICQGNMECGPRALGNRSILCDASNLHAKDILNAKVKFREWFRPFAPVCKKEDAHKYFYSPTFDNMEMMQFIADVKPEYRKEFPAITHIDNTARLQVVTPEFNEPLYNILDAFDGVLINTSFNVQGKPILNSMKEAMNVLDNTGLDHVVVEYEGDYWLF